LPRRKPPTLTEAELRLMEIVWRKGHATVAEVAAELPKKVDLAYNTVLTTLRILEAKGYLRHAKAKEARAFVYRPAVRRAEAIRTAVRQLLRRYFEDSPKALMLNLLEDDELGEDELKKIRKLLQESEGERE
jgi:predicted transcriptional regulator